MDTVVVVLWIVGLIFILIPLINIIKRAIKSKRCTAITSATITAIKERTITRNNIDSTTYIPTVSYTVNGQQCSREFAKAYVPGTYRVGQTVEIMYNPDKPTEINKHGSSNKADVVILIIGFVIILVGVVMLAVN
jgi:hypothetical protein